MLEPVTFFAPLGTWKMDVEKSEFQVEWWWWWWWGWWRWCWWWDTAKGLLREETHQAYGESSLRGGGRGGGSLSPSRSRIRGPARPFASQSKTQGSPLGGYLSWLHYTTLHYTTLHYIPLHSTTLHYITLHYITLNDTAPQIDRSTDRQIDRWMDGWMDRQVDS